MCGLFLDHGDSLQNLYHEGILDFCQKSIYIHQIDRSIICVLCHYFGFGIKVVTHPIIQYDASCLGRRNNTREGNETDTNR